MEKIIVGLGNPGSKYERTRHNIGQIVLESLSLSWTDKYKAHYACEKERDDRLHYLRPKTFMNLSGQSVAPCATFFKVDPKNILVIHDELDLPFGSVAFKNGGGLAGHNGLRSITAEMGTQDFHRLRVGIGRPVTSQDVSSYVLSEFTKEEKEKLQALIDLVSSAVKSYICDGFEKAAAQYSRKTV